MSSLFVFLLFISGCASYQSKVHDSRQMLEAGQTTQALEKLKLLSENHDGDQLVYLLDYGTALSLAGQYQESNKVLIQADKLADQLDYHSVSRVAGSMLLNEEVKQYKGDTFEKIFINAILALNYLELNMLDDALVEARRMNEKYSRIRNEDKKEFELNPFGKYLSALIWEADQKWDDAYIAYNEAYNLSPMIGTIKEDLIRLAKKSRRTDEYKKWKAAFPEIQEKQEWYSKNYGEIVFIFEQGWGPRKTYNPVDVTFPILRPIYNQTQNAELHIEGVGNYKTTFVYDVERAAIKTLEDDMAALIARRIAGRISKDIAAEEIRKKNELLGLIAWFAMHASDRADLRQWSTLPQTIQVARVYLPVGKYQISAQGLALDGSNTNDQMSKKDVSLKSNQKVIVNWRSLH